MRCARLSRATRPPPPPPSPRRTHSHGIDSHSARLQSALTGERRVASRRAVSSSHHKQCVQYAALLQVRQKVVSHTRAPIAYARLRLNKRSTNSVYSIIDMPTVCTRVRQAGGRAAGGGREGLSYRYPRARRCASPPLLSTRSATTRTQAEACSGA